MNVYLLGGLGADTRVFHKLQWDKHITPIIIDYLQPLPKEPLNNYAQRLLQLINTNQPFAIVGLSFGGWVTMALLQYVHPRHIILISSNATIKELPLHYKLTSIFHLHKLMPVGLGKKLNVVSKIMMGVKQPDNVALLQQIFATSNTAFTKWAINVIMRSKFETAPSNIVRIHGDKDYILPIKNQKPNYVIKNGGHLIILENATEISAILNSILK